MPKRMSTAIVPYVAKRAKYGSRAKMAMALGRYAWNNRYRIKRGYQRLRKVGNKIVRLARREIGDTIGSTTAQRNVPINNAIQADSRTLYTTPLIEVPEGMGNDKRLRDTINLRGWVIWQNITNLNDEPLYYNWAVISDKEPAGGVNSSNFFRGYDNQRAVAFSPAILSTLDFRFRPINTDIYSILAHRRVKLGPRATDKQNSLAEKVMKTYVPLRRQMRFDIDGDEIPIHQVYFVWWFDYNNSAVSSAPFSAGLSQISHITAYWRNSKH